MSTRFDPDELRELEHRLTERLEGIAPRPRAAAAERVRAEISMTTQRRGPVAWLRGRLPALAWTRMAAVAAVAVVALVVGIAIGTSGVFQVGKSPQPTASGPVSSPPPFGVVWQQVTIEPPDTRGDYVVQGGYAGPTRTVLVGQVAGPAADSMGHTTPAAWYSDDDVTWHRSQVILAEQTDPLVTPSIGDLSVVFAAGQHLYAFGEAVETGGPINGTHYWSAQFESADGGATWEELARGTPPTGGFVRDVTIGGPGYVAVGDGGATLGENAGVRIWTSTDGINWTAMGDPQTGQPRGLVLAVGGLRAVAEHDGTLMAVGTTLRQDGTTGLLVTSTNGVDWRQLDLPQNVVLEDVTWADGTWIAGGLGFDSDLAGKVVPAIYRSLDDGGSWEVAPLRGLSGTRVFSVAPGSIGMVAVSDGLQQPVAWTSGAGVTWVGHALSNGPFHGVQPALALTTPRGLLVAGNGRSANGDRLPVAWFSPTSPNATPPPEPASESATPAPTGKPTPLPSTSPLPESPIFTTWSRVDLPDPAPDEFGGTITRGLVRFGDRWIAVGFVNGGCCAGGYSEATRGVIWTSADGEHWALVPPQESLAHARIYSVATNGKAIVAVGIVEVLADDGSPDPLLQPASWYSTDGTTWHLVGNAPSLALVTVAGGRFVAASEANRMVTLYTSADGHAWTQGSGIGPGGAGPAADVGVFGLAGRPDGWVVAVGYVSGPSAGGELTDSATIWSTFDPESGIEMTSNTDGSWMNDVAALDGAWMAVGATVDGTSVLGWDLAGDASPSRPMTIEQDPAGSFTVAHVLATGSDVVVLGTGPDGSGTGNVPRLCVEVGAAWYQVDDAGLLAARPDLSVAAWDDAGQRILILGTGWNGHPAPVMWMAAR